MRVQCITDLICNFAKLIHGYIALINIAVNFCFIFYSVLYLNVWTIFRRYSLSCRKDAAFS
ncbi:MAG: hypothetical protein DBX36_02265 [Oscillospiraceae bacterium]|nr:MAG: hypothetical protein DBX36_02265 [Oscillospiraceae bacterium]